jgi:hypothetical protein
VLKSKLSDGSEITTHVEDAFVIVKPSLIPQFAPDWITEDELFKIAEDDGDIYEVNLSKKQQSEINAKNANPVLAPNPSAPATGWQSTAQKPNNVGFTPAK